MKSKKSEIELKAERETIYAYLEDSKSVERCILSNTNNTKRLNSEQPQLSFIQI